MPLALRATTPVPRRREGERPGTLRRRESPSRSQPVQTRSDLRHTRRATLGVNQTKRVRRSNSYTGPFTTRRSSCSWKIRDSGAPGVEVDLLQRPHSLPPECFKALGEVEGEVSVTNEQRGKAS